MKEILSLEDEQYPFTYIDHVRYVSRGILLNEKGQIALMKVSGDDIFGHRDYYETPGGGKKDKESIADACIRELQEETGYSSVIIKELGIVIDYYNLIHRKNRNYYFLCKTTKFVGKNLDNYEKTMINELTWVDIDKAIELYENMGGSGVAILVKNRELPILKKVKKLLEKKYENITYK